MSTYWYCCECGDGPHNAANVSVCHCRYQHMKCSNCTTETPDHPAYASYNASYNAHAGSSNIHPSSYSAPYNQRPEREPIHRWLCCVCGSDNSCKTDQGCAVCANHWKCDYCVVYKA